MKSGNGIREYKCIKCHWHYKGTKKYSVCPQCNAGVVLN